MSGIMLYYIFLLKTSNFGTFKINIGRSLENNNNNFIYNTPRYIAFEVLDDETKSIKHVFII